MSGIAARARPDHKHTAVRRHALLQRAGVPYEVQRTVCAHCGHVFDERPLRRTAA